MQDLQTFDDKRVISGYKSMLLYRDPIEDTDGLYHMLLPLETTPTVVGSVDTFDFDLLTSKTKGQIEGKESLDQKDVEFMWHRDNVRRLEALQGKVLDFLVVYGDFTGRGFSGTIRVRPNDATADILRGTFTITPISAMTSTLEDCSDLIKDTFYFTNSIPDVIYMGADEASVNVQVMTDPIDSAGTFVTATSSARTIADVNYTKPVMNDDGSVKTPAYITITNVAKGSAIITIKASNPDKSVATWETTILVKTEK